MNINQISYNRKMIFLVSFNPVPKVEIKGPGECLFRVEFIDEENNNVVCCNSIYSYHWVSCGCNEYVKWLIKVKNEKDQVVFEYCFDLEEKNVLIEIEKENMEEILYCINLLLIFKNKHKCNIICLTAYGEFLGSYGTFEDIEFHDIEGYEKEEKRAYAYYKIDKFMNKKQMKERLGII